MVAVDEFKTFKFYTVEVASHTTHHQRYVPPVRASDLLYEAGGWRALFPTSYTPCVDFYFL